MREYMDIMKEEDALLDVLYTVDDDFDFSTDKNVFWLINLDANSNMPRDEIISLVTADDLISKTWTGNFDLVPYQDINIAKLMLSDAIEKNKGM